MIPARNGAGPARAQAGPPSGTRGNPGWGGPGGSRGSGRPDYRMLGRAIQYIGRYSDLLFVAYGPLFLATAAQLMVPQLIQGIIDPLVGKFTGGKLGGIAQFIANLPVARGNSARALVV